MEGFNEMSKPELKINASLKLLKAVLIFIGFTLLGMILISLLDNLTNTNTFNDMPLWGRWILSFIIGFIAWSLWNTNYKSPNKGAGR